MENTKDELFLIMQKEIIRVLRFARKNENNEWIHDKLSEDYLINWTMNNFHRVENISNYDVENEEQMRRLIELKVKNIFKWIKNEYKSKGYVMAYNKKYYQEVTRVKKNYLTREESNRIKAKKQSDESFAKVKEAYDICIKAQIKPTIFKCMELSGLSKNTVNKYLKQIKIKG